MQNWNPNNLPLFFLGEDAVHFEQVYQQTLDATQQTSNAITLDPALANNGIASGTNATQSNFQVTVPVVSDVDQAINQAGLTIMDMDESEEIEQLEADNEAIDDVETVVELDMAGIVDREAAKEKAESTIVMHKRVWKQYADYMIRKHPGFDPTARDKLTPTRIAEFIMMECDSPDLKGTNHQVLGCRGLSLSHAKKIRAAVSAFFVKQYDCKNERWHENSDGSFSGNPTLSGKVAAYCASLRKKKIQMGEKPLSVRAVTQSELKLIHDRIDESETQYDYNTASRNYAIYLLSFLCLLRIEEALRIKPSDIIWINGQIDGFELMLDFRKTSQDGQGCKPFYLYANQKYQHLCPVSAVLRWILAVRGAGCPPSYNSELFCTIQASGNLVPGTILKYESFRTSMLKDFKLAVGHIKVQGYGTHSFRRGGCQYFHCEIEGEKWNLKKLCNWGGWSLEFDNFTIVRYLLGHLDDEACPRKDYMRPT